MVIMLHVTGVADGVNVAVFVGVFDGVNVDDGVNVRDAEGVGVRV